MSHADVPPSPNQLHTDRSLSNSERQEINWERQQREAHQEERKQLWRDSMVAILQAGVSQSLDDAVSVADAILEEYDKRFDDE